MNSCKLAFGFHSCAGACTPTYINTCAVVFSFNLKKKLGQGWENSLVSKSGLDPQNPHFFKKKKMPSMVAKPDRTLELISQLAQPI